MELSPLVLGNNSQNVLVCANMISSWERKVFSIAKSHMSPGILQSAVALVAGISLLSILQEGD